MMKFVILLSSLLLAACSPNGVGIDPNAVNPTYWTDKGLAGEDKDRNGIRDDVDQWIGRQSFTEKQKRAANQFAKAIQIEMVTEFPDREAYRAATAKTDRAMSCLWFVLGDAYDIVKELNHKIVNTRERVLKEYRNSAMASGMVFDSRISESDCD